MPLQKTNLGTFTYPVATHTKTLGAVEGLVDFGFTADEVLRAVRAYISPHNAQVNVLWAPDTGADQPTPAGTLPAGTYAETPDPGPALGHPIAVNAICQVAGDRQMSALKIYPTASTEVTITLEG